MNTVEDVVLYIMNLTIKYHPLTILKLRVNKHYNNVIEKLYNFVRFGLLCTPKVKHIDMFNDIICMVVRVNNPKQSFILGRGFSYCRFLYTVGKMISKNIDLVNKIDILIDLLLPNRKVSVFTTTTVSIYPSRGSNKSTKHINLDTEYINPSYTQKIAAFLCLDRCLDNVGDEYIVSQLIVVIKSIWNKLTKVEEISLLEKNILCIDIYYEELKDFSFKYTKFSSLTKHEQLYNIESVLKIDKWHKLVNKKDKLGYGKWKTDNEIDGGIGNMVDLDEYNMTIVEYGISSLGFTC